MDYEALLIESDRANLIVKEKNLLSSDGRIYNNRIALRKGLSSVQKTCVLAEELGHHYTSAGDIIDLNDTSNRKQEYTARLWAYNRLVGLAGIIRCFEANCHSRYEMAQHLNVTEEFLTECLYCYTEKYSPYIQFDNYIICFTPNLSVMKVL